MDYEKMTETELINEILKDKKHVLFLSNTFPNEPNDYWIGLIVQDSYNPEDKRIRSPFKGDTIREALVKACKYCFLGIDE